MADTPAEPDDARRRRPPHSWPQRAVLVVNSLVVVACLATAAIIFYGNVRIGDRQVVTLNTTATTAPAATTTPATTPTPETVVGDTTPATTTIPPDQWDGVYTGDTTAKNFLITGQSTAPCVDPNDPTAGGFGAGNTDSHLTDSIMIMRISPATNQAAVLSFPRDLWVKINGRNGSGRINSAYDPTNPSRLANTITDNFGIPIDHYINLNLCMFKTLVDAVGGVNVPFLYPMYDKNVGLDIPEAGCISLDGNQALAWVRTRKLWYLNPDTGEYKQDASSDFGRISRQQDFLRRLAAKAISEGFTNPGAATAFINQYLGSDNITTDSGLTVGKMLDFVSAMRNIDPSAIRTYQVETVSQPHNGLSTLGLESGSDLNAQVFEVFQGRADLATIATGPPDTSSTDTTTTTVSPDPSATTLPVVDPTDNLQGIVPPDDPTCKA
jgi:LCP family protein required for cell wall assembly